MATTPYQDPMVNTLDDDGGDAGVGGADRGIE